MHLWNQLVVMTAMFSLACSNKCSAGNTYTVDVNNAAAWSIGSGAGADSSVTYGFEYGSLGIPKAPGVASMNALLMTSNTSASRPLPQGITISPVGLSLTGDYVIRARVWGNTSMRWTTGSGDYSDFGSTQMFGVGVGYTGGTLWCAQRDSFESSVGGGSGTWFASAMEGAIGSRPVYVKDYTAFIGNAGTGANVVRDPSAYFASVSGTATAQDSVNPYYQLAFPGPLVNSVNSGTWALVQNQELLSGTIKNGIPGIAWREYSVARSGTTITWSIDDVPIASVSGMSLPLDGATSLTYFDPYPSVGSSPRLVFALVSSYEIELVPEPSTYAMALAGLACGGYSMFRRRRVR